MTKPANYGPFIAFSIDFFDELTHDELQAVIAGLAGVAAEGHVALRCETVGAPPFEIEGTWREGFIVNPATQTPPSLR